MQRILSGRGRHTKHGDRIKQSRRTTNRHRELPDDPHDRRSHADQRSRTNFRSTRRTCHRLDRRFDPRHPWPTKKIDIKMKHHILR
jgi:hypothetical protein